VTGAEDEQPFRLLVVCCFNIKRDGKECPMPSECEATDQCLVQMLIDKGWRCEEP
jgi:hypothetical protein